jgi:hypothetical protein
MGMEDPAVAQARQREQAMSGLDMSSPEAIMQRAQQIQYPRLKMQLQMLAQQMKEKQVDLDLKKAHAQYYMQGGTSSKASMAQKIEIARREAVKRGTDLNLTGEALANYVANEVSSAIALAKRMGATIEDGVTSSGVMSTPDMTAGTLSPMSDIAISGPLTADMKKAIIADAMKSGDIEAAKAIAAIPVGSQLPTPTKAESAGAVEAAKQGAKIVETTGPNGAVFAPASTAVGQTPAQYSPAVKGAMEAASTRGKSVGEEQAGLPKQEEALIATQNAIKILDKGIYTGMYGPAQKIAVAATPGVDKTKVANTDEFLSIIGQSVIPRLKEFGGNDSNQELQFLQKVQGGDITMQESAIRNVLIEAERKIQRGIDRVRAGMDANGNPKGQSVNQQFGMPPPGAVRRRNQ